MSPLRILALVGTALLLQGCGGADHPPVPLPQAVGDAQETKSIAETPPEPHEATDWDVSYAILARDTGEAGICAKIDPLAVQGFGFNPPGRQLYSMRARCYFDVALVTGDGRHCDEVVSRSTPLLDGSAVSREACLAEVGRHKRDDVRRNGPQLRAQPVLERMGYTSDMIPAALIASETDASSSWDAFYRTLVDTPDFHRRLALLPDLTSSPLPTTDVCPPSYVSRPGKPVGFRADQWCCADLNASGSCDDQEPALAVSLEGVSMEPVPGMPPAVFCGGEPLQLAVRLRNSSDRAIPSGAGWVELVNLNPLEFGIQDEELRVPISAIPARGEAVTRFPSLTPKGAPDRGLTVFDPRVLLAQGDAFLGEPLDLSVDWVPAGSPRCLPDPASRQPRR